MRQLFPESKWAGWLWTWILLRSNGWVQVFGELAAPCGLPGQLCGGNSRPACWICNRESRHREAAKNVPGAESDRQRATSARDVNGENYTTEANRARVGHS